MDDRSFENQGVCSSPLVADEREHESGAFRPMHRLFIVVGQHGRPAAGIPRLRKLVRQVRVPQEKRFGGIHIGKSVGIPG